MDPAAATSTLIGVAHVIQLALTPVFLLSAIAALLGVFSTRLARVSDQVEATARALETADAPEHARLRRRLRQLRHRSLALDVAGVTAAVGGAATGCATLVLFIGSLQAWAAKTALVTSFGLGVLCTIGALVAFMTEMLLASRGVRLNVLHVARLAASRGDEADAAAEARDVACAPSTAARSPLSVGVMLQGVVFRDGRLAHHHQTACRRRGRFPLSVWAVGEQGRC